MATLIWGTSFVVFKSTLDTITPLWVLAIRFGGAAVIMLVFCVPRLKVIDWSYIKGGALMGTMLASGYIVQTYGLVYTSPGKNAFLTATYCILVPFLVWLFNKKKPDAYNIIAAMICLVGMGFVCLNEDLSVNIGDILTVCCGLFYGLHIIVTASKTEGRDPLMLTMIQFFTGGIICLVLACFFEPVPEAIPKSSLWSIAYLCVMCTGMCFFLQTVGQKYTPPAAASMILTLESVFGTMLSIILGYENLTAGVVFGFVLIFFAIVMSETKFSFLKKR